MAQHVDALSNERDITLADGSYVIPRPPSAYCFIFVWHVCARSLLLMSSYPRPSFAVMFRAIYRPILFGVVSTSFLIAPWRTEIFTKLPRFVISARWACFFFYKVYKASHLYSAQRMSCAVLPQQTRFFFALGVVSTAKVNFGDGRGLARREARQVRNLALKKNSRYCGSCVKHRCCAAGLRAKKHNLQQLRDSTFALHDCRRAWHILIRIKVKRIK